MDFGDPFVIVDGSAAVGLGQRVEDAFCEVVNIVNSGIGQEHDVTDRVLLASDPASPGENPDVSIPGFRFLGQVPLDDGRFPLGLMTP